MESESLNRETRTESEKTQSAVFPLGRFTEEALLIPNGKVYPLLLSHILGTHASSIQCANTHLLYEYYVLGFPGGAVVKNLPANPGDERDTGLTLLGLEGPLE